MAQPKPAKDNALEDQLRGMILGNVRIGSNHTNSEGHHGQRGRGRGRGGYWRGDHAGRSESGHQQVNNTSSSHNPHRGRGRGDFNNRGYRQNQNAQPFPHAQQGPPGLGADTANLNASPNSRHAHSNQSHASQHSPRVQPQHILHRPHNNGHVPHGPNAHSTPQHPRSHELYQQPPHYSHYRDFHGAQVDHLEQVAAIEIPKVQMSLAELEEKEAFRLRLESILKQAIAATYSNDIRNISLVGFGSLSSGFGMPGSDMDLAVVLEWIDPAKADPIMDRNIPRVLERAVLDAKMGGRLLTRTRVPILKVCEAPTETLYTALFDERKRWDELSEDEKYPTEAPELSPAPKKPVEKEEPKPVEVVKSTDSPGFDEAFPAIGAAPKKKGKAKAPKESEPEAGKTETQKPATPKVEPAKIDSPTSTQPAVSEDTNTTNKDQQPRAEKAWMREKVLGPLDFPKSGCGIQCDLNFGNPLGIHNTHMLRCYSLTDPRVRPIVLFVKSWAKRRKINSAYSGTLSSYGWVLMVLHYLVNIAHPPVCPNLQLSIPPSEPHPELTIFGYKVSFWRTESQILQAAHANQLSRNSQPIGALLRGFFQYFASISGYGPSRPQQFYWTTEVLSLRSPGGILSKQAKGWTGATTLITAERKVTNRYLLAIEDPFELDHNVARTVTHRGIVAIRDEFRRAWRILGAVGRGVQSEEGGLFDEVFEEAASAVGGNPTNAPTTEVAGEKSEGGSVAVSAV